MVVSVGGIKTTPFLVIFLNLFVCYFQFQVDAAPPAGPLIKHVSSLLKWTTRPSSKIPQSDGISVQFEDGYIVETVIKGNELGIIPYRIRISQEGELFAVDAYKSNIVRITPPLTQYSRARLVAGSFQGYTGHVDGKASDSRFYHPKDVTMDDKGNVYVADTSNLAIRKIGDSGVTTIAGGKSNIPGYRDGPSEDAKFSSDFGIIYVRPTCSLLVVDRGNAALRQISLNQEDCDYEYSSVSATDILMVIGAVLIGYLACMLQQGFGSSFFSKMQEQVGTPNLEDHQKKEKAGQVVETMKEEEEEEARWPSFGQLVGDLSKLAFETLGGTLASLIPFQLRRKNSTRNGLTPLKDSLIMPEDEAEPPLVRRHRAPAQAPAPSVETSQAYPSTTATEKFSEVKPPKIRSSSLKDPSLSSSKHRSSRRQEYAEYYGSGEGSSYVQVRSKSQKERTKHRQKDKNGVEVTYGIGTSGVDSKPVENNPVNYDNTKYEHQYSMRSMGLHSVLRKSHP